VHPLITEAMKKAAIAWLTVAGRPAYPVWCTWIDEALYLVSGPGEQPAPGLAEAATAGVTARGDHGGRIVTWTAHVDHVVPGTPAWESAVPLLAAKRLNSLPSAELTARWAAECAVHRLTPADEPLQELPGSSLAAPPRPTPAVPTVRKPRRQVRR
jgi:hypothetical protein